LSSSSRFEDVQARLHKDPNSTCPKPCQAPFWAFPSLFCTAVTRPFGYEVGLMKAQAAKRAGIFGCDEYGVWASKKFSLGSGIVTIPFFQAPVGVSKDGTAGNAALFMNFWDAVHSDFRYHLHDFTIKADPDAVLLPDRIRNHLASLHGQRVYVKNCAKFVGPGWPMMFGSLEAFSRSALDAYFAGQQRCKNELQWYAWGEDLYMGTCMDHLGVGNVADMGIISDGVCRGVNCGDGWSAAFHPFKDVGAWFGCFNQAIHR